MDSPIFTLTVDGIRDEVFSRFYRISDAESGEILIEFGKAHMSDAPADFPPGSVLLNRGKSDFAPTPLVIQATPRNAALLGALRKMRPADVSHIQMDGNGCGPAVVAYLTGRTYEQTRAAMFGTRAITVTGTQKLAEATGTRRHRCKPCTLEKPIAAGAVAALIKNTDPRFGRHYGHFVSIDGGRIVDPELIEKYPLAEYPRRQWTVLMYFTR